MLLSAPGQFAANLSKFQFQFLRKVDGLVDGFDVVGRFFAEDGSQETRSLHYIHAT